MNRQTVELIVPRFNHEPNATKESVTPPVTAKVPAQKLPEPARSVSSGNSASITKPKLVKRVEPRYTADALAKKIEGKVRLSFFVMPNGHVRTIRVVHRLDMGLDRAAIDALSHWRYTPALVNGLPTTVEMTEEMDFRLP